MKRVAFVSLVLVSCCCSVFAVGACSSSSTGASPGTDGGSTTDAATTDSGTPTDSGASTTIAAARSGNVTGAITVQAVVTALHGSPGDFSQWYIEDQAGGQSSGVNVYCDKDKSCTLPEPKLHDLVLITGTLSTYKGVVQMVPTAISTVQANATLPPVATITISDLAEGASSLYRGVLVKYDATKLTVDDLTPTPLYDTSCNTGGDAGLDAGLPLCTGCAPPSYSGFQANDGQGHEVYIENVFFSTDPLQSSPECTSAAGAVPVTIGMTFSSMQGILDYDPYAAAQQIAPVQATDYATP
jgi:hypothetical protein